MSKTAGQATDSVLTLLVREGCHDQDTQEARKQHGAGH